MNNQRKKERKRQEGRKEETKKGIGKKRLFMRFLGKDIEVRGEKDGGRERKEG